MSYEDERIVKMTFDNEGFKKGVSETIAALENLEKRLKNMDAGTSDKTFETLTRSAAKTEEEMGNLEKSVSKVQASFTMLQIVGMTAISELTRSVMTFGKKLYANTLGQIKSGGTARALNLEAAKFQIEGLGKTWSDVEEDINYGVKDTAYGLDAAAKTASLLLASQVQIGDEMKTALRGISGVAAMTNSTYEDISNIFTDVAGAGRLMGDQLNRLSYRGLNTAAYLKDYFNEVKGIAIESENAMKDFVSKGKVSFKDFAAAMDWAFGEHAKEANKTFTGALANMKAALSRVGEKFVTPLNEMRRLMYTAIIPAINTFKKTIDAVPQLFTGITKEIGLWAQAFFKNENFLKTIYNITVMIDSVIYNIVKALNELNIGLPDPARLAESLEKLTNGIYLTGDSAKKFRAVIKALATGLMMVLDIVRALFYAAQPLIKLVFDFLQKIANNTDGARDKFVAFIGTFAEFLRYCAELAVQNVPKVIAAIAKAVSVAFKVFKAGAYVFGALVTAIYNFATNFKKYGQYIVNGAALIANTFVGVYRKVREVLDKIIEHISDFAGSMQEKATGIKDKILDLFSGNITTATVALDIDIPKINLKDIIQNDAASKIKDVASSMSDYSSASKSAAANSKKVGGIGSGGAIKGSFNKDMVGASAALKAFAEQNQAVQEETEETSESVEKSTSKMAEAVEENSEKAGKSFASLRTIISSESVAGIKESTSKVASSVWSAIKTLGKVFTMISGTVLEHIQNFYSVLTDLLLAGTVALTAVIGVISYKLINSLINVINMVPNIFSSLLNLTKGYKYSAMADAFNALFKVLLAFAGLLVVIGIISKVCDTSDLKNVIEACSYLVLAFSAMAYVVSSLAAYGGIRTLVEKLPGSTLQSRLTAKWKAIGDMFKGLAIMLGALVASILVILAVSHFAGPGKMMAALAYVSLMLGLLVVSVSVMNKMLTKSDIMREMTTLDLRAGKLMHSSTSAFGGMVALMLALVPLMTSMTFALSMLSMRDPAKLAAATGAMFLMLSLVLGSMTAMLAILSKRLNKIDPVELGQLTTSLNAIFKSMIGLIAAMAGFMISFAVAVSILSVIDKFANIDKALIIMSGAMMFFVAIITGTIIAFEVLRDVASKNASTLAEYAQIGIIFESIVKIITALSAYMISFAAAMAIVSMIPEDKIAKCGAILLAALAAMTVSIGLIAVALKDFTYNTSKTGKSSKRDNFGMSIKTLDSTGEQIAAIVKSFSVFMLTIASSAAILSMVPSEKLVPIATILAGVLVLLTTSIILLTGALRSVSSKNKAFGEFQSMIDGNVAEQLTKIIFGMSIFIGAVAGAMALISAVIPKEDLAGVSIALVGVVLGLTGAIGGLLFIIKYVITQFNKFDGTKTAKNLMAIAGTVAIMVAAMISLLAVVGGLALIFDGVNEESISAAVISAVTIFAMLMVLIIVVSKLCEKGALPDVRQLGGLIAVVISLSTLFVAFGITMAILSTINWSALDGALPYIMIFGVVVTLLTGILAVAAKGLQQGVVGLLAVAAVFLALGGLIAAVGYSMSMIANAILSITETMDMFGHLKWSDVEKGSESFKTCLKNIVSALGEFSLNVVTAYLLGKAINLIVSSLSQLKEIDKSNIITAAVLLSTFASELAKAKDILKVSLGAAVLFGFIGPLILVGLVSIAISLALIPSIMRLFGVAINSIVQNGEAITEGIGELIDIILDAFDTLTEKLSVERMQGYCEWLLWFMVIGAGLAIGGVLLLTGALSIVLAAVVLSASASLLINALGMFETIGITTGDLGHISELTVLGIFLLISGTLLLTGAAVMIIAAGLLWLSGLALVKGLEYYNQIAVTLDTLGIISSLAVLGLFLLIAGTVLLTGSAVMIIGSALLYASAFVLSKAIPLLDSAMNTKTITRLMKQFALLSIMGATAIVAGTVLTIAGVLFLAFGATMLIGAVAFMGAMLIFAAGISLVQSAAESFSQIAENFVSFGEYIVEGLIQGISNMFDDAVEVVGGLADAISETFCKILKINSPSELFADFGKFICEGLGIGIDDNSDKATTEMDKMGGTLADSASTWGDKIKNIFTSAGTNSGGGFASNFVEQFNKGLSTAGKNFSSFTNWFNNSSTLTAGQTLTDLQNQRKALEEGAKGKRAAAAELRNDRSSVGYDKRNEKANSLEAEANAMDAERKALQASIDYYAEKEKNQKTTEGEYQPPDFDTLNKPSSTPSSVPEVTTPETDEELKKAGNGPGASTAMASNVGGNVSNTITTNNNYNFIQNNYSPEPIDRTELYTQTENQHYTWFKWLRDNS